MTEQKYAHVQVFRFNPEQDTSPVFQEVKVPFQEHSTVLDALRYIYDHLDSSLAFRESCLAGLCGLCAVRVNGTVCLACSTYMSESMKIEPLPHRKIIRDLVVDYSYPLKKIEK
ncbi:MAG: 2Fe-2S iron-sulfur cluster binding domain-containing protein [Theionarchaea archaeon]|nr:2Fe-2S iron-sulfur cluster binding domain-containing protein [Theionarchaea archaeon]